MELPGFLFGTSSEVNQQIKKISAHLINSKNIDIADTIINISENTHLISADPNPGKGIYDRYIVAFPWKFIDFLINNKINNNNEIKDILLKSSEDVLWVNLSLHGGGRGFFAILF